MIKKTVSKVSVLLLLAALLSSFTVHGARPLEAYTASDKTFSLADLKDKKHRLPDYRGKVVLVNFWASWCPPCIYEMPELTRLKNHFADQPFEVLAINVGEKKYKVRKFVRLINFELPVLLDTSKDTFDNWEMKSLPTSFLIDAQGNLRYRVRGNPGWDDENTIDIIKQLISENSKKNQHLKTDTPHEASK